MERTSQNKARNQLDSWNTRILTGDAQNSSRKGTDTEQHHWCCCCYLLLLMIIAEPLTGWERVPVTL